MLKICRPVVIVTLFLFSLFPAIIFASAKSCQFLLNPSQIQFDAQMMKLARQYQRNVDDLNRSVLAENAKSLSTEFDLTISTAPLNFFFNFHSLPSNSLQSEYIRAVKYQFHKTFMSIIYRHRAGRAERAELLKEYFAYEERDFDQKSQREYARQNSISLFIDPLLGLDTKNLEEAETAELSNGRDKTEARRTFAREHKEGIGLGAGHDFWFTPHIWLYLELKTMHSLNMKSIVDLGTGTGRLGLIAGFLFPEIHFVGLEIYAPRIQAAQAAAERFGFSDRIQFRNQDLLDKAREYPEAEYYYVYGPTNSEEVNSAVINRLQPIARNRLIVVSSSHSVTTGLLEKATWLSPVKLTSPRNSETFVSTQTRP